MFSNFLHHHERTIQRLLEILTGIGPWIIITFPIWASFWLPGLVAYLLIVFYVYWVYKSWSIAYFSFRGYKKIQEAKNIDWLERCCNDLKTKDKFSDIHHILVIPNYKEKESIIRKTLDKIVAQTLPKEQMTVVLAMEAREKGSYEKGNHIAQDYKDEFGNILVAHHELKEGEVIGKSSNEAYAAKKAKRFLVDKKGISIRDIIITTCDVDSIFPRQYFACLTYKFLTNKNRYYSIWQAPIFPYNNIDRVPIPIRVISTLGSMLFLTNLQKPSKLTFNYSTYSISLRTVDSIGYWDSDVISEDWHMFLKCFFHLQGKVEIEPIFLPIYSDAPEAKSFLKALINRYEQCKREAWGTTDIPYAIKEFFHHPEIPLLVRLARMFRLVETHFLWSACWFLLAVGATIPPFINDQYAQTVLSYNLTQIASFTMNVSLAGAISIILVDTLFRSKKGERMKFFFKNILTHASWLLLPVYSLFLAVIPSLDAHIRLLLGKYLEYRVTEKV